MSWKCREPIFLWNRLCGFCLSWKNFPNLGSTVRRLSPINTTGQNVPPVPHSLPAPLLLPHDFDQDMSFRSQAIKSILNVWIHALTYLYLTCLLCNKGQIYSEPLGMQ